jgi:hypothetical protein
LQLIFVENSAFISAQHRARPFMQTPSDIPPDHQQGRGMIWLLSLIAFAPLAILTVMLVFVDRANAVFLPLLDGFKTVSAVSLSFLGGIRCGMAMKDQPIEPRVLAVTLLPAAIGWVCLFLPDPISVSGLLLIWCGMGAWDSVSMYNSARTRWYGRVRTVITLLAAFAHIVVLITVL